MYHPNYKQLEKIRKSKSRKPGLCKKTRYRDKDEAIAILHKFSNLRDSDLRDFGTTTYNQIRTYLCDKCQGWHLTSSQYWDSRKRGY